MAAVRPVALAEALAFDSHRPPPVALPPPDGQFRDIAPDAAWFEALLRAQGRALAPNGPLTRALAAARRTEAEPTRLLPLDEIVDLMGVGMFLEALRDAYDVLAPTLAGHWRVFSGADLCLVRPAGDSNARNLAWEIYTASRCGGTAAHVALVEPPDVLATVEGRRWGLSCKVFYTPDRDRHIDAIVKGADQLERADIDAGVVVVHVANLLDQGFTMPRDESGERTAAFPNLEIPRTYLRVGVQRISEEIWRSPKFLERLSRRPKAKAIALVGYVVANVQNRWFRFAYLNIKGIDGRLSDAEQAQLHLLLSRL